MNDLHCMSPCSKFYKDDLMMFTYYVHLVETCRHQDNIMFGARQEHSTVCMNQILSLSNSNANNLTQILSGTKRWQHNRVTVRYELSSLRFPRRGKKVKVTLVQVLRLCTDRTARSWHSCTLS
jgi:hypothetical protein